MTIFSSELSGSLIFNSASIAAAVQPFNGGINISGSELYINEIGLDTRIGAIEAGAVGSSSLLPLNQHSASLNLFTSSLNTYTGSVDVALAAINTFTQSSNIRLASLESPSAAYLTLSTLPTGTVSSSIQIDTLGFITSASAASAGFGSGTTPSGTISSSLQLTTLGFITGSDIAISSSFASTASFISDSFLSESIARQGFGSGGGGGDVTALNTFTGSYFTDSGSFASRIASLASSGTPEGTVSSSLQVSQSAAASGFGTNFDGNRIVSSENFPGLVTSSFNANTSGSVQDFLNAVFFPNSAPSFTSAANQEVTEFATSGSTVLTLTASDPEGQSLTFALATGYTDGYIVVSSTGVITLNVSPTEALFNTVDRGDGELAHPVDVVITDTFGTQTTKTFYFKAAINTAPVFRQTSTSGTVITSFTANRNENASAGVVGNIYFTDAESDSITINSSSVHEHFNIVKYPTYVQINQLTASLDYENITSYTMSISASDEHYGSGVDTDAITPLLITVNVTDNIKPVVNDQVLGSINENSSNGTVIGSIAASDNESDTITFRNFTLSSLELDNAAVSQGTYAGSSQLTDPHENPFQMASNGQVTRKSGVYINSDLINEYIYSVEVVDSFNVASDTGSITINIDDDTQATLTDNWSAGPYIIESATAGNSIVTISGGSTQADYGANQSGTFASSNAAISVNSSNGKLTTTSNISGSALSASDTINSTITFTNTFGTTTSDNLTVNVTANAAPTAVFTNQTAIFNSNQATDTSNLVSVSVNDTESNSPYQLTIGGTDAAKLTAASLNEAGTSWELRASEDLTAGTYTYTVTITDNFNKSTTYSGRTITIAAADTGSMSVNGSFYIIESATSGDVIRLSSNGRTGTQGAVTVSYTPNYGSQAVSSFTSSNSLIGINSTGELTVGADNISGSGNIHGGSPITSDITFQDQYGNSGTTGISITVSENQPPDITFTDTTANLNTNLARTGNTLTTLTFSDVESNAIQYDDFVGVESAGLNFVRSGTTYLVQPTGSLAAGSYTISGSIADNHGFSTNTEAHTFTIASADTGTLNGDTSVYIIESAVSGNVYRDATGYNNGNTGQVGVTYSTSYGTPTVQSYTSSNASIVIDNSGNLTLGVHLSGSVTQSGDSFNSTITFRDQFDNIGSGTVTATVFGNQSPSANFTAVGGLETDTATSGSDVGSLTVSDTETDTPFIVTLGGTHGSLFDIVGNSSPYEIQPKAGLAAGTFSIDITIIDNYAETVTLSNESITVAQSSDYGKVYVYISTYGSDAGFGSNYLAVMGAASVNSDVPPEVTSYTGNTSSPYYRIKSGDIGNASISLAGGSAATLLITGSGSDLDSVLNGFGTISANTTGQVLVMFPSGSDMTVPSSIQESFNSVAGGAVPALDVDGNGFGIESGIIHSITLDTAHLGYSEWFIFGRKSRNSVASGMKVRLVAANGSLPT
tara:strand:+ start:4660 stop:9021 length:4362 start_codon:yes stop_codon:yes gene_type:complete